MRAIPLELERGHGVDRDVEQLRPAEVDDHVVGRTQDEGDLDVAARGVEAGHIETECITNVGDFLRPMRRQCAGHAGRHERGRVAARLQQQRGNPG